jgi:hypothetical protein
MKNKSVIFSSSRNIDIRDVPKHIEIIDKGTHFETADGALVYWGSQPPYNQAAVI